ncbi:MAG TPA: hypothetical protein VNW06_09350 [Cytophagaceae bacterium]|jgi:hypothetical protein|nr:hypothetical protein [Cytophagaceae bacterium]
MKKSSDKNKKEEKKPKVNKDLKGFDITVNNFGEINSTFDLDKLNEFLDKNVEDKKLKNRNELPTKKGKKS